MRAVLIAFTLIATTAAVAQAPTPPEYTLRITPADVTLLGQAIDELPAKIGRPLAQRLLAQVQAQDADYAKKNPVLDKSPAKK